jgi:NAD(P)-dependent dehydrogenase (short-subunit alcohol dehydrogenase family)
MVCVADLDLARPEAVARAIGNGAYAVALDITEAEHASAMVERVTSVAGRSPAITPGLITLLASDESGYITGQTSGVKGGILLH